MQLEELKADHYSKTYLFNPEEYGRIFAFVDFANVRKWAKSFWKEENKTKLVKEIDISKIAELIDFIKPEKKYFYYGYYAENKNLPPHDPINQRHRSSIYRISKARTCGFIAKTKEVKEINTFDEDGHYIGKVPKCNLDIEIAMDMLQDIEKYDTVFLWSGDSDFHKLLQSLIAKGKKVVIICAREFASIELNHSSYLFIPADPLRDHLEFIKQ